MTNEHLVARVGMIEMIKHFHAKIRDWELAKQYNPETDEIWAWDTGGWNKLAGRAGYVLVRNGEILHETAKITKLS